MRATFLLILGALLIYLGATGKIQAVWTVLTAPAAGRR